MRIVAGIIGVLLITVVAGLAWAVSPREIEARDEVASSEFDPDLIARGRELALIGNCADCHTVEGGEPYAGGLPMETPLGTIYATNITPHPETGIGRWSEEAFRRAMHEGLDREGNHLYPAFPYDHFTLVRNDDISALYAYLMTREPVDYEAAGNELVFPLGFRPLLAGWKLLFLEERRYQADPTLEDAENAGRYLVDGLGHCGACHTPRNFLQAEIDDRYLGGGTARGWYGPALDETSRAPVPWTQETLASYLRTGFAKNHGAAAGPMRDVTENLARVPEEEVRAIASYIAKAMGAPEELDETQIAAVRDASESAFPKAPAIAAPGAASEDAGAVIYAGACAGCHTGGAGERMEQGIPLSLSTSVRAPEPINVIQVIRHGVQPTEGKAGHYMPGFDGALTNGQIASVVTYVRETFTDLEPWEDVESAVEELASGQATLSGMDGGS